MRLPIALFLLAASLLLSACGSDDADKKTAKVEDEKAAEHKAEKIHTVSPICPQVAIVRGLDVVRDYGHENPDTSQLVAAAKLRDVKGDCEYRDDGIDVAFRLSMAAKRGPRLGGMQASFPIFVAVVDPSGEVLNKNQMTAEVKFSSDEATAMHEESLHVFIPLPKAQHSTGPFYKILSGFQLSPEQAQQAKAVQ